MKKKEVAVVKRIIKQWHDTHIDEYNEFVKIADAALETCDITMFEKNSNILEMALPSGVTEYFSDKENNPLLNESNEITPGKLMDGIVKMQEDLCKYTPEFYKNLKEQRINTQYSQMFSMYYWLYYEDGAKKLKRIYTKYLLPDDCGIFKKLYCKTWVGMVVSASIKAFMNSKKEWVVENQQETDVDTKTVIKETLNEVAGVDRGRNDVDVDLDQMLNGNSEKLMLEIGHFVINRKHDSHLGYILHFLEKAECIEKKKYDYMTFHRAVIRQFPEAGITGYDRAQSLYSKLQNMDKRHPRGYSMNTKI